METFIRFVLSVVGTNWFTADSSVETFSRCMLSVVGTNWSTADPSVESFSRCVLSVVGIIGPLLTRQWRHSGDEC